MEELDARDVDVNKVPTVASATFQGQILLKPLAESIVYTSIKEDQEEDLVNQDSDISDSDLGDNG